MVQGEQVKVEFIGLKPPPTNVPTIELQPVSGKFVDLYNDCDLLRVVFDADGLAFEFSPNETRLADESRSVVVRFRNVRNLSVEQPTDWASQESTQIDHLMIRPPGDWRQGVFKAGGMEFEFDCASMALSMSVG
jgi:hypothetical protein